MQNRYAGDSGDFMKLGLLRHLAAPASSGGAGLSVGLNWYLAPDENHNEDGRHFKYVYPSNRWHRSMKACDPDLIARLREVVDSERSVAALEASGALPTGSLTHNEMLNPAAGLPGRRAWHERALVALAGTDLVLADPDNGIRTETPGGSKMHKFALVTDELADYAARGQIVIAYHHADRKRDTTAEIQAATRLAELAAGVGQSPVGAVIAHRGTCRFFLVTAPAERRELVAASLSAYATQWAAHADVAAHGDLGP